MNDRIKELLNEATSGLEPDLSLQRTVTLNEMQKFAELIIQECMKVSNRSLSKYELPSDKIAEHFGVEL